MKKERKEKNFVKKPVYPGGPSAMKKFVSQNLKYPKSALDNKIEGSVYIRYSIDFKGKVIDTKVISSLGHGCDEEAQRIVKLFKFQIDKQHKIRVKFHKNIHIHFRLPKTKSKPQSLSYTYSTSTNKSEPETDKKPPKSGGSYNYTISW